MKDEVVSEVRQVRERQAAKFGYDFKAIIEDARKRHTNLRRRIVSIARPAKKAA